MSQVRGNYDYTTGAPLPSVEVKPVEVTPVETQPKEPGWFARAFNDFGLGFASTQAHSVNNPVANSASFDFSSLISGGEKSDRTNQLLLQLFVFIGLMVLLLFAFKLFKK